MLHGSDPNTVAMAPVIIPDERDLAAIEFDCDQTELFDTLSKLSATVSKNARIQNSIEAQFTTLKQFMEVNVNKLQRMVQVVDDQGKTFKDQLERLTLEVRALQALTVTKEALETDKNQLWGSIKKCEKFVDSAEKNDNDAIARSIRLHVETYVPRWFEPVSKSMFKRINADIDVARQKGNSYSDDQLEQAKASLLQRVTDERASILNEVGTRDGVRMQQEAQLQANIADASEKVLKVVNGVTRQLVAGRNAVISAVMPRMAALEKTQELLANSLGVKAVVTMSEAPAEEDQTTGAGEKNSQGSRSLSPSSQTGSATGMRRIPSTNPSASTSFAASRGIVPPVLSDVQPGAVGRAESSLSPTHQQQRSVSPVAIRSATSSPVFASVGGSVSSFRALPTAAPELAETGTEVLERTISIHLQENGVKRQLAQVPIVDVTLAPMVTEEDIDTGSSEEEVEYEEVDEEVEEDEEGTEGGEKGAKKDGSDSGTPGKKKRIIKKRVPKQKVRSGDTTPGSGSTSRARSRSSKKRDGGAASPGGSLDLLAHGPMKRLMDHAMGEMQAEGERLRANNDAALQQFWTDVQPTLDDKVGISTLKGLLEQMKDQVLYRTVQRSTEDIIELRRTCVTHETFSRMLSDKAERTTVDLKADKAYLDMLATGYEQRFVSVHGENSDLRGVAQDLERKVQYLLDSPNLMAPAGMSSSLSPSRAASMRMGDQSGGKAADGGQADVHATFDRTPKSSSLNAKRTPPPAQIQDLLFNMTEQQFKRSKDQSKRSGRPVLKPRPPPGSTTPGSASTMTPPAV